MSKETKTVIVPIEKFGKDHWSTFAYIVTRCVDYKGKPDNEHMRCDKKRHPHYAHRITIGGCSPTMLKGYFEDELKCVFNHDDWDCIDDLIEADLLNEPELEGTGLFPVYKVTNLGWEVSVLINAHKSNGGYFSNFEYLK